MIGALVVTHGGLAREFVAAAKTIEPNLGPVQALVLDWNCDPDEARKIVQSAVDEVNDGDGVVILTDMFGGTPSNLALTFLDSGQVEVVTGVNLPMMVKLRLRETNELSVVELAKLLAEKGRRSISVASDLLVGERAEEAGP